MAHSLDDLEPRQALSEIARDFHSRGWMSGTAGNLSARADPEHFWITASGQPKGRLGTRDFLLVRIRDGAVVESADAANRPSAETAIHAVLYRRFTDAQAVLHGHTVDAVVSGRRGRRGARSLRLPAIEMIKGFDIWTPDPKVDLPLFENHLKVDRVAAEIEKRFRRTPPPLSALLIRDHGATVWGRGLQEAYNRFECLEFLFAVLARR